MALRICSWRQARRQRLWARAGEGPLGSSLRLSMLRQILRERRSLRDLRAKGWPSAFGKLHVGQSLRERRRRPEERSRRAKASTRRIVHWRQALRPRRCLRTQPRHGRSEQRQRWERGLPALPHRCFGQVPGGKRRPPPEQGREGCDTRWRRELLEEEPSKEGRHRRKEGGSGGSDNAVHHASH